jgi:hypothetical protein
MEENMAKKWLFILVLVLGFGNAAKANHDLRTVAFYSPGDGDSYWVELDSYGRVVGGQAQGTYFWQVTGGYYRAGELVFDTVTNQADYCTRRLRLHTQVYANTVLGRYAVDNCGQTRIINKTFIRTQD